jgi:hypothetical protein
VSLLPVSILPPICVYTLVKTPNQHIPINRNAATIPSQSINKKGYYKILQYTTRAPTTIIYSISSPTPLSLLSADLFQGLAITSTYRPPFFFFACPLTLGPTAPSRSSILLALLMLVVGLLDGPLAAEVLLALRIIVGGPPGANFSPAPIPPVGPPAAGPGGAEVTLTVLGGPAGGALALPAPSPPIEGGGGVDRALVLPPLGARGGGGVAVFFT